MQKILLSALLLSLAAPVWAQQKVPPPRMGISAEDFLQVQADAAAKYKTEQEPLLKKLNDQAKKTADCRMAAVKAVTPTVVDEKIKACDEEARTAIEKINPLSSSPSAVVSGTVVSATLVSGSLISGTIPMVSGSSPSMLVLPPVFISATTGTVSPAEAASTTKPAKK